jgi:hypothetical protein
MTIAELVALGVLLTCFPMRVSVLELLVLAYLFRMLMKTKIYTCTSHVSDSKHIVNFGTIDYNIDWGNFTDLAHMRQPNKGGLSNPKCHQSESISFQFIHWRGVMNA